MAKRPTVKINLPVSAHREWDTVRGGYPRTVLGIAALVAFMSLSEREKHDVMTLAGNYDDGRADWSDLLDWVKKMQAEDARLAVMEADAGERRRAKTRIRQRSTGDTG